jgi:hypothetical protein
MGEYAYENEKGENAYDLLYNYLPDDVNKNYNSIFPNKVDPACYRAFDSDIQSRVNTLWEDLKISGSIEVWVHVATASIVGAVVILFAYTTYVKKKRSRDYRMRDKAARAKKLANSGKG